ncbi:hypothetical protein GCM10023084_49420 [Streptomyces lacrimifluminis]|uniref:DUF2071 domain-containing protein n=1 Tax=Streptomyces lacrimifluminis TaxID=1500077 RepID=A0A917L984_9ACTN|nr:hypothetical protein GCM10012282_52820 [Streptomyces lacrimifluminis]
MVAYGAEQRVRVPALRAAWLTQTVVHWPFPPRTVQAMLPEGLVVDAYAGAAWVGFTPFVMADVRPPGVPARMPDVPTFAETNLRTCVRHRNGRDGLWFLSVEVACPLMVAARAIGAPCNPATLAPSASPQAAAPSPTARRPSPEHSGRRPAGRRARVGERRPGFASVSSLNRRPEAGPAEPGSVRLPRTRA